MTVSYRSVDTLNRNTGSNRIRYSVSKTAITDSISQDAEIRQDLKLTGSTKASNTLESEITTVETNGSNSKLPAQGTLVNLYSRSDSQLLGVKYIRDKWHLEQADSNCSFLPMAQFLVVRTPKFIGFRSALANGCLLQANKKFELGFVNPKLELWERWEPVPEGFRNARFRNVFIAVDVVPYSGYPMNMPQKDSGFGYVLKDRNSEEQKLQEMNMENRNHESYASTQFNSKDKEQLMGSVFAKQMNIQQLENRLEKLETSYQRLSLDHTNCLEYLREAKKTIKSLESEKESMQEKLSENLNMISFLQEKCTAEAQYKEDLMRRIEVKESRIAELEKQLRNLDEQLKSKERLLSATQKNLRNLRETAHHPYGLLSCNKEWLESDCKERGSAAD